MTSRTAWTGGVMNSGLGWTNLFAGSDLNSLTNAYTVLSSLGPFTNGTSLDQFMDVSFVLTISSNTIAAGASLVLWLAKLQGDGSTYGDGSITTTGSAGQSATVPGMFPKLVMPLRPASSVTKLVGENVDPLIVPPGTWLPIFQNNSGFTLSGSGNAGYFRTYNTNLNN